MNLYSKKQRSKLLLFVLASLIIGVSLWYSNVIVGKIRNEERKKVELWSNAIQNKAELVSYTQKLFDVLRSEEKKKVKHWFLAISILSSDQSNNLDQKNLELLTDIISDNTTIPIVMVDDKGDVITQTNLLESGENGKDAIDEELKKMKEAYPPLEIRYTRDRKQFLYYRDSHIFRELQQVLDNLINNFISETVLNSASVPVLFTDSTLTEVIAFGNLDSSRVEEANLPTLIEEMRSENAPIAVTLDNKTHYIFYRDSFILTQLKFYPYIQLVAIAIFLLISYLLFSTFRNAEQNQVWVGMAKETAHQLGTPLSSLLAWKDLLALKGVDEELLKEMGHDIQRLEVITDRFSKIGASPELNPHLLLPVINKNLDYLRPRMPRGVVISVDEKAGDGLRAQINIPLFDWVLENLIKNAVDAMQGKGTIDISFIVKGKERIIDIKDSGKGIPNSKLKTVFEPGYTTRKRGWGLGLTLVKRIVEDYHSGRIFVKESEQGKGTTFRIVLAG